MKVNSVNSALSVHRANVQNNFSQNPILSTNNNSASDIFIKREQPKVIPHKQVNFMGASVHIVDGGRHLMDIQHFANSLGDMDIVSHMIKRGSGKQSTVDVRNLAEQLKYINDHKLTDKDSYVAIPVSISVPILRLKEQFQEVTGKSIYLKPDRVRSEKPRLLDFLKKLYENRGFYRENINILDPNRQGLEFVYPVITEINRLAAKGKYVPAEHAIYSTLTGKAAERNLKPELYDYIATGRDDYGHINNLRREIDYEKAYDFNLLGLSNAEVVTMKGSGNLSQMYSAYDMSVTDAERGVYNFSPVRDNGKIIGYSFHDTFKNEYPFNEFPGNELVEKISKFVGVWADEVVANDYEIMEFQRAMREGRDLSGFANKLYPTHKVMSEIDRWNQKADIKGDYVDSTFSLFFRKNNHGQIIFPKCDCEGSGRPSVMSMWGSCFSIFNVIKRNVQYEVLHKRYAKDGVNFYALTESFMSAAQKAISEGDTKMAIKKYEDAIESLYIKGFNSRDPNDLKPFLALADLKFKTGDYNGAEPLYNKVLNHKCQNINEIGASRGFAVQSDMCKDAGRLFSKLAVICEKRGDIDAAHFCKRGAEELYSDRFGQRESVLNRRADRDLNIGDLVI